MWEVVLTFMYKYQKNYQDIFQEEEIYIIQEIRPGFQLIPGAVQK